MPRRPPNADSDKLQADDQLLTAEQVAELLGISESAVYQQKSAAAELTPLRFGKRKCTRWSRNEVQALIARKLHESQQQESPAASNVFPLKRAKRHQPFTRKELEALIITVRKKQ